MSRILFEFSSASPTHQFETGLAKPQRTIITEASTALLAGLLRPTGYLGSVVAWGSVVRSYTDEKGVVELMDALSARAPAIAIATGDGSSTTAGIGGFQAKKSIDLLVYFCTTHKRNSYEGRMALDRAGAADLRRDPGLHIMMEHAAELLIGQRAGAASSIKQIFADREEELVTDDQCTLWLQTYSIETRVNLNEFRNVTQLLDSIRWRLATNPNEVHLPAPATDSGSLDLNNDNLGA